ncbi:prophage pi2 protein 37 [Jeotgalibacillus malaysiensis]|uniref:Prophage pi2 protein 37 n=1 Tax=Jeotgalibacillus malaysiensis TaxID=1508404 RepID=A0A0B5APK7_9BACL|nr:HK97 gp10 family phage protein [Jeotgalibacillus malaysiensis]AJD92031.1 prophage pi2 protein 37 [Jeotgalibacillus malaysiensis]
MTNIGDLAKEISRTLSAYTDEVKEGIEKAADIVATDGVAQLKSRGPYREGDYRRGWAKKKTKDGYVVYNKTNYQLTHLLEHGHATRNGGRVAGRPHIRPVEEDMIREFERMIEKVVRG